MMRLEVFVARKVGSLVGLGKNYNRITHLEIHDFVFKSLAIHLSSPYYAKRPIISKESKAEHNEIFPRAH